jgi:hypothetical protein
MSNMLDEIDGWSSSSNDSNAESLEVTVSNKSVAVDDDKSSLLTNEISSKRDWCRCIDWMTLESKQSAANNIMQHANDDASNCAPVSQKKQQTRNKIRSEDSPYHPKPSPSRHSGDEQIIVPDSFEKLRQSLCQHQRSAHVQTFSGNVNSSTAISRAHSSQTCTEHRKQNEYVDNVSDGKMSAKSSVSQYESISSGLSAKELNTYNDHANVITQVDLPDVMTLPRNVQSSEPLENITSKPINVSRSSRLLAAPATKQNSSFTRQLSTAGSNKNSSKKSLCVLRETRGKDADLAVNVKSHEQALVAVVGRVKPSSSSDSAMAKTRNLASRSEPRHEQNKLRAALHYYNDCISCAHCFDYALCMACNSVHCPNGDDDDLDVEPLSHQQSRRTSSCNLSSAQSSLDDTTSVGHCVNAEQVSQPQHKMFSYTARRITNLSSNRRDRDSNHNPEILHNYSRGSDFVDSCSAVEQTNSPSSFDSYTGVVKSSLSCDFILDVVGCTCLIVLITTLIITVYRHFGLEMFFNKRESAVRP